MRRISMILLTLAGAWIVISALTTLYLPDLTKPYWLQAVDFVAILLILFIVLIEIELQLRSEKSDK